MTSSNTLFAFATLTLLAGCVENGRPGGANHPTPPPLLTEPIGRQIVRAEPRLADTPFRVLLDFERPTDLAFVRPAPKTLSTGRTHTGEAALRLKPGVETQVKLAALVPGPFPARWALAGAYFTGTHGSKITIAYRMPEETEPLLQRTVELARTSEWTGVFLDLTQLPDPATQAEAGLLTFTLDAADPAWCDDVVLVDNAKSLVTPPDAAANPDEGWTIRQSGFGIVVEKFNRFRVTLKTPDANPDGWTIEEASDVRARLLSAKGHTWTIYPDGRQYRDGEFSPMVKSLGDIGALYAEQHASPAEIAIPEEFGRLDRDTPGDQANDGYNEHRGSYQIAAKSNRLELTITPRTKRLAHPVLEISGLPEGSLLVTVEGQLVEKSSRLPNGNILIELPQTLDRPTAMSITVK
jgi:hypothetical protein